MWQGQIADRRNSKQRRENSQKRGIHFLIFKEKAVKETHKYGIKTAIAMYL